jgi:hypothetical protein
MRWKEATHTDSRLQFCGNAFILAQLCHRIKAFAEFCSHECVEYIFVFLSNINIFKRLLRWMNPLKPIQLLYIPPCLQIKKLLHSACGLRLCHFYKSQTNKDHYNVRHQVIGFISDKECVYCAVRTEFSGLFAKLLKATISFFMPVCPSARMEQFVSNWTDFHEIWYSAIFWKPEEKIQLSLICDRNNGTAHEAGQYAFSIISRSVLLRMRNVADKSVEKIPYSLVGHWWQ